MNGSGINRYGSGFEKISKKMKLLYPCAICGEKDYSLKEVHHIDENKKNSDPNNLIVLCIDCHKLVHNGKQSLPEQSNKIKNKKILLSNDHNWINNKSKVDLIIIDSKTAMKYRKQNIKGWVKPGGCNLYLGMIIDNVLRGVLGFSNPDYGNYGLMLKADTTNSDEKYSIDLLLYLLKSNKCRELLEKKFNRIINNVYSTCFSSHIEISRYRKHGEKVKSIETNGGYNISYLFELGKYQTIKEAFSLFLQKHKDI